jgi:hypothetical protein
VSEGDDFPGGVFFKATHHAPVGVFAVPGHPDSNLNFQALPGVYKGNRNPHLIFCGDGLRELLLLKNICTKKILERFETL